MTPESSSIDPGLRETAVESFECSVTAAVRKLAGRRLHRVALVSHPRHLNDLDPSDGDLLVVSTDWLVWQSWLQRGGCAVHYEGFLDEWPSEAGPSEDIFARHNDWMYDGDLDLTLFKGVSLGKLFTTHAGFVVRAHYRLISALDRLFRVVSPAEVVFFDTYVEFGVLSAAARRSLALDVIKRHGLTLDDRFDPVSTSDPQLPEDAYSGTEPESRNLLSNLRDLYTVLVDVLSTGLMRLSSRRDGVFMLLNWSAVSRILEVFCQHETNHVEPVLLASQQPKTLGFIARCLWHGVRLVHLPRRRLTRVEKRQIELMKEAICAKLAGKPDSVSTSLLGLVQDLIACGEFETNARLVKSYSRLFQRKKIRRVVIGDVGNGLGRLLAELAYARRIPCDEILNGVFVCPLAWDARNGDGHRPPIISRMLTWGPQNELWLSQSRLSIPHRRTGYPAMDFFRSAEEERPGPLRRALVLPLSTECSDVLALRANVFSYLVETVALLTKRGYEVRVKLHPGRPRPDYYRRMLSLFGLQAEIFKEGSLKDHLSWATLVVGPINSGAFLESVGAGRPYYPLVPRPSSIAPALCGPALIMRSPVELAAAIDRDIRPDTRGVLEFFCEMDNENPSSRRFWQALDEACNPCSEMATGS